MSKPVDYQSGWSLRYRASRIQVPHILNSNPYPLSHPTILRHTPHCSPREIRRRGGVAVGCMVEDSRVGEGVHPLSTTRAGGRSAIAPQGFRSALTSLCLSPSLSLSLSHSLSLALSLSLSPAHTYTHTVSPLSLTLRYRASRIQLSVALCLSRPFYLSLSLSRPLSHTHTLSLSP